MTICQCPHCTAEFGIKGSRNHNYSEVLAFPLQCKQCQRDFVPSKRGRTILGITFCSRYCQQNYFRSKRHDSKGKYKRPRPAVGHRS